MGHVRNSDTWLKEFEEAMELAEDIASRIRERDNLIATGGDPAHLISATRRKITVLGTNLDRLQTLLQNPPAKPILDEKELYRRHEMILGIQYRTKKMAASLSTSNSPRTSPSDHDPTIKPVETPGAVVVDFQKQDEQAYQDPQRLEVRNPRATKHVEINVNTNLDLHAPFLSNLEQGANDAESIGSSYVRDTSESCSFQLVCLVILGILCALLIVWTLIRIIM